MSWSFRLALITLLFYGLIIYWPSNKSVNYNSQKESIIFLTFHKLPEKINLPWISIIWKCISLKYFMPINRIIVSFLKLGFYQWIIIKLLKSTIKEKFTFWNHKIIAKVKEFFWLTIRTKSKKLKISLFNNICKILILLMG